MIEFACHTWGFNDLTLMEALGTIARMGFRYVDIGSGPNLNAPRAAERPRQAAAEITADLETFNLRISDLYLMLPRISAPDDTQRQRELDLFERLLPFAQAIGAPGITVSPGLRQADAEAEDRVVAALRQMLRQSEAAGLALSIEPHLDSMAPTPETALRLLRQVTGLYITLDWAQMICQDIAPAEIRLLLPHTRHVQVRQAASRRLQTPYAQGRLAAADVLAALADAHYAGVICVEYMNTTPGWHGTEVVDSVGDGLRLRDALRAARDAL